MKKLLALAVLATSTVAYSASDIYDIQYLPSAGTVYGFSEVSFLKRDIKGKQGLADTEVSGYLFDQTIGWSMSDRLTLNASLGYGNYEIDTDGADAIDQTGVTDPRINARFRIMDETYRWDILGGALISLMDSEIENNGDRDMLNGGHSVAVGTQFGQKSEAFQWAVGAMYTRNFERTIEVGNTDVDIDGSNELQVRADFLNKLAEKSLIRYFAGVDFTSIEESDDLDPQTFSAPTTTYTLGGEYQHLFSKDLLGRVDLQYDMANADSAYQDSDKSWTFNVAANYQF